MAISMAQLLEHWQNNPQDRLVDGWLILQSGKEFGFVVEPGVAKTLRDSIMDDGFENTKVRFVNYVTGETVWVSLRVDSIVSVIERDSKVVLYEGGANHIIDIEPIRIAKPEEL